MGQRESDRDIVVVKLQADENMVTYSRTKLVERIKDDKDEGNGIQTRTLHVPITIVIIGSENSNEPQRTRSTYGPLYRRGIKVTVRSKSKVTMKEQQLELEFIPNSFEKICDLSNLHEAFKRVKRNKGAPGIDGITIEEYETNLIEELRQLRHEVLNWAYEPSPVRRVEIPKPGGKGVRLLGVPNVKDRVLQMAIKSVLEPQIDPTFSNNSYGFRPGRNQKQAVEAAQRIVQSGKEHTVDIDLSKFFDRINHDRLIHRLKSHVKDTRVLRLIGMTLRSGVISDGALIPSTEGSVQGSPLSPLLSNVVLDELDKELEKRGLEFCRFADDSIIFVKSARAAERVLKSIIKFIEETLLLKVNHDKSKTGKSDSSKFLGMVIINGTISMAKESINRAMEKVKELIPRRSHLPIERVMDEVNIWYRGWASYYMMTQYPAQLRKIEAHIRRRFRARLTRHQKKKKHLFRKLKRLGVSEKQARKTAFSNHKTWVLSHTRALEKAFPVKWFTERLGQVILSNRKWEHWFGEDVWLKFV